MYDQSVHSSFRNVALKKNFTIDDLIAGLEKSRDQLVGNIKQSHESEIRYIENSIKNKQSFFINDGGSRIKNLKIVQTAYLYAVRMKEAGIENLELDVRSDLAGQVIDAACEKLGLDKSYISQTVYNLRSPNNS